MGIHATEYNGLGMQIVDIIKCYCAFPGAILRTQCMRINKATNTITKDDLTDLAEWVGKSVENFTNPVKGKAVKDKILNLLETTT